jgi:6-phosphogluconolactonase
VQHELVTLPDAAALASRAAELVTALASSAVGDHGWFRFAVSGGHTPWAMFAELTKQDVPWSTVEIYQVDERVAPDGDPDRNLAHLRQALDHVPAHVVPMPVDDADLEAAADSYAARLPGAFDVVHLGLGPDGHTASLVPADPVLDVSDRLVTLTNPYQGHRRMTLTFPALARAQQLLWLIAGEDKRDALGKLLAGDQSIPAGRVRAVRSTILADAAAAEGLGSR